MAQKRREKGEGSYVKRKDGTWQFSIDLGKDGNGRRQRRTFYGPTKAAVKRKFDDERARAGGSLKPRVPGTVGERVTAWLSDMSSTLGKNSYIGYETAWRLHAELVIGNRLLEKFDVPDVEQLRSALEKKGASPSVINRVEAIMKRAFNAAIRARRYNRPNPFAFRKPLRVEHSEMRVLERAEVLAFLKAAKGDRYEALWTLLLTTGLRLGEALALRWSDVDLAGRTISVSRSLLEVHGHVEIGTTKTRSSRRLVTIGDLTVRALKVRSKVAEREDHESELVFPTAKGTEMRRGNLRRSHFVPILKAAGLTGLRIHDLRHSMASLALQEGVAAKVVAERLGHSTTRLTLDRYSHLLGDLQANAADAIEGAFSVRRPRK
jgi:integrase